MIRRLLIAGALASVLATAVVGAAASITNTVPKFGSDTAAVSACDSTLTTAWDSAYDATLGAYEVTDVTISGIDGTACATATLKVTLSNSSNVALGTEKIATIASTDTQKVFSYASENISAENVANVNVVIVGP